MMTETTRPTMSMGTRQGGLNEAQQHHKVSIKTSQLQRVASCFFSDTPQTMLQVAHATGIERASICRYVATLRKENRIKLVRFGLCPITTFRAGFYSTKIEREGGSQC